MKKQITIKCLIVVFLFNIFAISNGFDSFKELNRTESNGFQINMGSIHSPININGNGNFTLANGVSSGAGTYEDPYIIRDLIIEVVGSQSCINITNTNVFFKIENCTLETLGLYTINLINVSNGWIHNNDISLAGISLFNSHNNTISDNILLDHNEIYIGFSNNNNILNNYIKNSTFGIKFISSNNNTIDGNEIYDCSDYAIGIWFASNSSIINNNYIFNNGGHTGEDQIHIHSDSNGTVLSGNIYAYRSPGGGEFPWLLILIIILIVSGVAAAVVIVFAYRRYRKVKETKHPEPPEPLDTTDLW